MLNRIAKDPLLFLRVIEVNKKRNKKNQKTYNYDLQDKVDNLKNIVRMIGSKINAKKKHKMRKSLRNQRKIIIKRNIYKSNV